MIQAKIRYFDIRKIGFYRPGIEVPEFGGINESLRSLRAWALDGREFVNTTTYAPDPTSELHNTYFCDWHHNPATSDSLLILWNEVHNDDGVIYGMRPMDRPGNTSMLTTGFGSTPAIPGFPSYFWFIPEKQAFAAINFNHSVQGKVNLDYYLTGFLENKSPYRVLNEMDEVEGFSADGRPSSISALVAPKFRASARKLTDVRDELLANRERITKIIKVEKLKYSIPDQRRLVEKLLSNLLSNSPSFLGERAVRHELDFKPSELQLLEIIEKYDELDSLSSTKKVGFKLNDQRTIMLSGMNCSVNTEIGVDRSDNQIIPSQRLLTALTAQRSLLLNALDQQELALNDEL